MLLLSLPLLDIHISSNYTESTSRDVLPDLALLSTQDDCHSGSRLTPWC